MRNVVLFILLCSLAPLSFAQAFAPSSPLTRHSCQATLEDFLLNVRKNLANYVDKQLPSAHRGGARNTRNFVATRKSWIEECDTFLKAQKQSGIFRNSKDTTRLVSALDQVINELDLLVKTPKRKDEDAPTLTTPPREAFVALFGVMDKHLIDMQKRGLL